MITIQRIEDVSVTGLKTAGAAGTAAYLRLAIWTAARASDIQKGGLVVGAYVHGISRLVRNHDMIGGIVCVVCMRMVRGHVCSLYGFRGGHLQMKMAMLLWRLRSLCVQVSPPLKTSTPMWKRNPKLQWESREDHCPRPH